ncbi:MAG: hypothetical protein HRU28_04945 [Rhizobiales bacterium]|nr:hypothetical protein [Hyphomicrobiales bacterium]
MDILDSGPIASLLGRGSASITVPTLDGAFRTNDLLESAELFVEKIGADCLANANGRLILSAGHQVYEMNKNECKSIAKFEAKVTALAAYEENFAVGLENGGVEIIGGRHEGKYFPNVNCATSIILNSDELIVAEGSDCLLADEWARDLLEKNNYGKVISLNLKTKKQKIIADGAAWAGGLVATPNGEVLVTQSWRHCLSKVDDLREKGAVCANLPGYPSRISIAVDGGYWMAIFGMRTQLLEFILREHQYRKQMLETVPPEYWIAPTLVSRENFMDPMQQGAVKKLGIKKPWAPPRSYGLVVKLDKNFQPQYSLHSRVGGLRHGVTSMVEVDGCLYVVSRGAGQVLTLDITDIESEIIR